MNTDDAIPPPRPRATPWVTAALAVVALAVHLWPGDHPRLEFDRDAIPAGEFWRLWTAHFVHFSPSHLLWNLAVLVPAGVWAERIAARRTRLLYLVAPAVIGVALLVFDPFLLRYAGLSGLATGALALLAFTQLGRSMGIDRWFWWTVLTLLGAKILLELFFRDLSFATFGDPSIKPVPLAHIAGIASAALVHGSRRRFHI